DGSWDSATVTCDLDGLNSIAPYGTPSRPLLTLDVTATNALNPPFGISVTNTLSIANSSLRVAGDIFSNSNIVVQPKVLGIGPSLVATSPGTIRAIRACTSGSGYFNPTPTCNSGTPSADPFASFPAPDVASLPN